MNHRSCRWHLRNKTEMMLIRKGYWDSKVGFMSNGKWGRMWCKTYEDYKNCTEITDPEEEEQYVINAFMELGK